ncbi:CaiB/BaiF CoA-transferase family protein [Primorskyibacter aestuariivivens]|uniref:CaiB/BaiF CoA transferase family protein n=1 Tax=Primorskyibacter aestuariivivens TaxID=1888912 RepID=UPI002300D919|nr:CaiB/BaiF CoA-transferase family protein [Primorskyibacter aestuariivivens]MDA7430612.1 CaiB/BaiF CoA-transferase family protein [Primorskyibacter aestuariivivens]
MTQSIGALHGLRVFDLTRVLAGPTCTQILADLGAEVIKIERPGSGDDTRKFAPPFVKDAEGCDTSESSYYCAANRNKKSVTLDISTKEGQDIALGLLEKSDILVENFKTGGLEKYGFSYDQLKERFPGLVYCSITGFGQTGPFAKKPGYDVMIQGMSGFMSLNGDPDGPPLKAGVSIADIMTGMYAAVAVNAALRHREATGQGQQIDISMLDSMVAFSSFQGMNYLTTGENPQRMGNAHLSIVPYQSFETEDGNFILAVANDEQFARFCEAAGCTLHQDPRFATNAQRVRNRADCVSAIAEIIRQQPSAYWLDLLSSRGVSCGPINTMKEVFENPQVIARELKVHLPHPKTGEAGVPLLASPIRLSETPVRYDLAPPLLGQHTEEVLSDLLDLDQDALATLTAKNVI